MPGRASRAHAYSPDQEAWIAEFGPHYTDAELLRIFNRRFGLSLAGKGLRQKRRNLGVKALYTGRKFLAERGPVYGAQPGRFRKGGRSPRRLPAGTMWINGQTGEIMVYRDAPKRVSRDGRGRIVQIHREVRRAVAVWEAANGQVPRGHVVLRLVDDRTDDRLEVLMCVERGVLSRLTWMRRRRGFRSLPDDLELRRAAVLKASVEHLAARKRRGA